MVWCSVIWFVCCCVVWCDVASHLAVLTSSYIILRTPVTIFAVYITAWQLAGQTYRAPIAKTASF